jgi:ferric-dicitrate binding protein FerR (iron transport regulator)
VDDDTMAGRRCRLPGWVSLVLAVCFLVVLVGAWRWAAQPRYEWRITRIIEPSDVLAAPGEIKPGAVQHGGLLRTGGAGEIEVALGNGLRVRLLPDSVVRIPRPPQRWISGEILITVEAGVLLGATGDRPLDLPLRVVTDRADIEISGATFVIAAKKNETRVAVGEGAVMVFPRQGKRLSLAAQYQVVVDAEGSAGEALPLEPADLARLATMAAAWK